ncbi:EamA family transporter [Paenibacillus faecis]|uniref:DMT family transporter n=1 Tax=Paenibacillus faecis TaxID=862114 RepID=UPI001B079F05|nr:EamA family transporter [Paenibacillus faecis]GIO85438.1 EamA family transporter [Paenibacillus faecis]
MSIGRSRFTVLVLLTTFLMGVAFPVGKIGLTYASPFLLMGLRFVLAGGLLAIFVRKRKQPRGAKQWLQAAVLGLFQSAGVMGFVFFSMRWINSGESAIITSTSPLMVIVLGVVLYRKIYRWRQWLGVVIGFAGVVLTFGLHVRIEPGMLFCFAGAVCFTVATLLINRYGPEFDMTVLAAYQMLAGGIALLVLSSFAEAPRFALNAASLLVLFWLAVMCSIVQFSLWFYLLKHGDPARTSAFLFLVPLFAVLCSFVLLDERIAWYVYAGGALICVGVFMVNWSGGRKDGLVHRNEGMGVTVNGIEK